MKMIPYGRQYIDKQDINVVKKALKSQLITTGKEVEKFEKLFLKKLVGNFQFHVQVGHRHYCWHIWLYKLKKMM